LSLVNRADTDFLLIGAASVVITLIAHVYEILPLVYEFWQRKNNAVITLLYLWASLHISHTGSDAETLQPASGRLPRCSER